MKLGTDHPMATHTCLSCTATLDVASCVGEDAKPEPGGFTICMYCGHLMVFADDLSFRELTNNEMIEIAGDKRVIVAQRARNEVMEKMTDLNGLPFRKKGNSLVPSGFQSDDWLNNVKDGTEVLMSGRRARNIRFHRLLFAMLHKIVDNTDRWPDEEILLADLKERTGYGHYRINGFTNVVKFEPASISFAKCDEYKFRRLFNRFVYVLATDVLKVEPQTLIDEVFEMVDGNKTGAWKYEQEHQGVDRKKR